MIHTRTVPKDGAWVAEVYKISGVALEFLRTTAQIDEPIVTTKDQVNINGISLKKCNTERGAIAAKELFDALPLEQKLSRLVNGSRRIRVITPVVREMVALQVQYYQVIHRKSRKVIMTTDMLPLLTPYRGKPAIYDVVPSVKRTKLYNKSESARFNQVLDISVVRAR